MSVNYNKENKGGANADTTNDANKGVLIVMPNIRTNTTNTIDAGQNLNLAAKNVRKGQIADREIA